MVAPESYGIAQPPESAISPEGHVATTGPSFVPANVTWLTTWWTEGEADVVAVGRGVGVGWVPPVLPPDDGVPPPEAGVPLPLATTVSVGCALPAVAVTPFCA